MPLKWHYPVGLLYDLFSGAQPAHASNQQVHVPGDQTQSLASTLPWKLTLHFSEFPEEQLVRLDQEGKVLQDCFINSVKEADFLRNGTAKAIMTLSRDDSTRLWEAAEARMSHISCNDTDRLPFLDDLPTFSSVHNKLLPASASLRHIPIRFYLPSSPPPSGSPDPDNADTALETVPGHINVVQSLVPPRLPHSREPQTLGTTLHAALPSLFPSRRTPILARPVLHGAVVPMSAVLEDLMRSSAFMDGWLHLGVEMIG